MENDSTKLNETIDKLLETHGKRIQPDELMTQRAKNNVRAHWQASIKKQSTHRRNYIFQVAAAVVFAVMIGFIYNIQGENDSALIKSLYANGELLVSTDNETWSPFDDEQLHENVWLKTNNSGFATITMIDDSEIRVNSNSTLKLLNPSTVQLIEGEIYHDADNSQADHLTIQTSMGQINHIGTRYLVNKKQDKLQIAVRNGMVEVSKNNEITQVSSGKQLEIDENGSLQESSILAYDQMWNWVQLAGQPFSTKGKSLHDFIIWYSHEHGYKISWNQQQLRTKNVMLSGQLANLTPAQQIKTIFLSTKFDYKINQGILTIL
jgi:hypothetical protein